MPYVNGPSGPRTQRSRFRLVAILALGCAAFVTLLVATLGHLRYVQRGVESHFWQLALGESFDWFSWVVLLPAIIWLCRRIPLSRSTAAWAAPTHGLIAALTSVITLVTGVLGSVWVHQEQLTTEQLVDLCTRELIWMFPWSLFIYSGIAAIYYALDYYRRYNEREMRASRLETELTRAQLNALHSQLQPHFLFNTLNSISVLMRKGEIDSAQLMLTRLSELLRHVLARGGTQLILLESELEIVRGYLEIEQTRFGQRLQVELRIEEAALKAQVPSFILQTLVENAVRHGLARKAGCGHIGIEAAKADGRLCLTVEDDGVGLPTGVEGETRQGIGLRNTHTRLVALYGEAHRFELRSREGGGTVARLEIPFSEEVS